MEIGLRFHLKLSVKRILRLLRMHIKDPDIPIMTTEEVANLYKDDPRIFGSGVFHEDLESITEEKFEELIETIKPINHNEVIIGGITFGASAALWPFVMAYPRKRLL